MSNNNIEQKKDKTIVTESNNNTEHNEHNVHHHHINNKHQTTNSSSILKHKYSERSPSRSRSRSRDRNNDTTITSSQQRDQLKQSDFESIKTESFDIETEAKGIGLDYFTLKQIAMTDEQIINLIESKKKQHETNQTITPSTHINTEETKENQDKIPKKEDIEIQNANDDNTDNNDIIMPKSHTVDINNTDRDILGATELAGKNNDKIPLPSDAKEVNAVFVGDLHHLVTRKDLLSVFGQVGKVIWIQLFDCHAQLNRPFNFAFIYYCNIADANKCIDELNFTKFYGNPCRVMLKSKNQLEWTNSNLIVKNLPPNTNSQILFTLFEPYGTIKSSKVKTTNTGRTLPYGYVQFNSYESAQKALNAAQNKEIRLGDNVISAEWFKSRDDRPNKQIFIKNIPADWDEKRIIEFVQDRTKFNIASISTKGSPYGKWACVAFYEFQHAQMAIHKLDGMTTGDYIHPKLHVSKFMNKSDRDKNIAERKHHHIHRDHHQHHHHNNYHEDRYHSTDRRPHYNNEYHGHNDRYRHNRNNNYYRPNRNGNMHNMGWNNGGFNINNGGGDRGSSFGMFSLYVGNIPSAITESHLQQIFESFGKIRTCHILEKTVDFRYGFVNFAYAEDAARALVSMNGKKVGDKCLQVKPTQKDSDKARQIEYFACVIQQNQSQFNGNNNNHYVPFVGPAHVTAQPQPQPQPMRYHDENQRVNPAALAIDEAERILCSGQHVIVWKVQYGDEWHEYNTQLAALTEQLRIGCKTTITLSDSDYLLTKIDDKQALQQNLTTGTTRKVVRLFRPKR